MALPHRTLGLLQGYVCSHEEEKWNWAWCCSKKNSSVDAEENAKGEAKRKQHDPDSDRQFMDFEVGHVLLFLMPFFSPFSPSHPRNWICSVVCNRCQGWWWLQQHGHLVTSAYYSISFQTINKFSLSILQQGLLERREDCKNTDPNSIMTHDEELSFLRKPLFELHTCVLLCSLYRKIHEKRNVGRITSRHHQLNRITISNFSW